MDELGTPAPQPHPLERARDRLARWAFVVSLVVLLGAAYAGMQRRAVLQELHDIDQAIGFWSESLKRAAALRDTLNQSAVILRSYGLNVSRLIGKRLQYVEARSVELLSSMCVDEATEQRLDDELQSHYEAKARHAQAAASAVGVRVPVLRAVQRSAPASQPLFIDPTATQVWLGRPAGWCASGFHPLPKMMAYPAMFDFAATFAEPIELMLPDAFEARVQAEMEQPSTPLMRLVADRFKADTLSELLQSWKSWEAERSWLLDELSLEHVPWPDKDPRGYRASPQLIDPISAAPAPLEDLRSVMAPIATVSRASPTHYVLEAGKTRARSANSLDEFVSIAQEELKLLAARRGPVERRGEPDANSASWGGFQLPLAVFVAIAVFPAVGLYLLYALYAAQAALLPAAARDGGAAAVDRHFWFPRLGCPRDPLASPRPRSLADTLPRAFWLLFHAAPLALAYSASVLGLDPLGAFEHGSMSQPIDLMRIVFGLLLVLVFHTAIQATSGVDADKAGVAPPLPVSPYPGWRRQAMLMLLPLLIAGLPAVVVVGMQAMFGFQSSAWIFDGVLLALLGALMYGPRSQPSNFAWLAFALLVAWTWQPYIRVALQGLAWLQPVAG
jgi:hypothetical protein